MANLSQTAANIQLMESAATVVVQAAEAVTQGMPVYLSSAKYYKALNDSSAHADGKGIALTPAAADEYFVLQTSGKIDLGATLTVGTIYAVADTAGGIRPETDNGTGDYVTTLGVATAADTLDLNITASGVAKP